MKVKALHVLLAAGIAVNAQTTSTSSSPSQTAVPTSTTGWQTGVRTGCSTEHLRTELVTNSATQQVSTKTHRYVSVSAGENYLDSSGTWQPSQDLIEVMQDGSAASVHGPCKAYFSPNLNSSGALTFNSQSNRTFSTHLLCLAYYSPTTGQRSMISQIRDCEAEIIPPNQIVWKSAFAGADVRVTYTKGAFETDVILTQQPQPPEYYGISSGGGVRLEVWHEYLSPPTPQIKSRVLQSTADPNLRSAMVEPDLVDQTLDFGDLWYPMGRVYSLDEYASAQTNGAPAKIELVDLARNPGQIPVAKTWTHSADGMRTYLIESVSLANIAPMLSRLPPPSHGAMLSSPKPQMVVRRFEPPLLKKVVRKVSDTIQIASTAYRPNGCCLDYISISGFGDYEFLSGTTYFISYGYSGGTVTFDANCILKSDGSYLLLYGPIVCNGDSGSYSILTSKNDDLYGDVLPDGSPTYNTHNPSAAGTAVMPYYSSYGNFQGMKFRWASYGIDYSGTSGGVTNCAFELCSAGIAVDNISAVGFDGVTMCGVDTPISGDSYNYSGSYSDICSDPMDVWECKYYGFTGLDPNSDTDGDGLTLIQEYILGTNPTVAARPDTNGIINLKVYTPLK